MAWLCKANAIQQYSYAALLRRVLPVLRLREALPLT